jgi:hypothetical protein
MNPLNRYPRLREALYLLQWVVTGIQTVASATLAFVLGEPENWPQWYLATLAVTPVVWTYLGLTAKANVPHGGEEFDFPTDTVHGGRG